MDNIDLFDSRADLQLDLREKWPFADASISQIYSEHVFEHFELHEEANSTFSWWGAWLNPLPNKSVIAPKQWHLKADSYYPNLLPSSWMLVDVGTMA